MRLSGLKEKCNFCEVNGGVELPVLYKAEKGLLTHDLCTRSGVAQQKQPRSAGTPAEKETASSQTIERLRYYSMQFLVTCGVKCFSLQNQDLLKE